MNYEKQFLISLIYTLIIEISILFICIKGFLNSNNSIKNTYIIFSGFLASFSTLPYLWFIIPAFTNNRLFYIVFGEFIVIIIESIIYFFILNIKYKKALMLSIICNLVSFITGQLINFSSIF